VLTFQSGSDVNNLKLEAYASQAKRWPKTGRHILAQFDSESVFVYQAYRPEIGRFAAEHGYFGGAFSLGRMSWIKPNFLWMMYRSGWASKEGQEVVLAVRLKRAAFDEILSRAVHSSYVPDLYDSREAWSAAVARSDVRLQWDPDHGPKGQALERRAIQLGLRGATLAKYARDWILGVKDVTPFVREQAGKVADLLTPREEPYAVADPDVARRLGL